MGKQAIYIFFFYSTIFSSSALPKQLSYCAGYEE